MQWCKENDLAFTKCAQESKELSAIITRVLKVLGAIQSEVPLLPPALSTGFLSNTKNKYYGFAAEVWACAPDNVLRTPINLD